MGASVFVCVGNIEVGEGLSWVESGVDERSFCIDEKKALESIIWRPKN